MRGRAFSPESAGFSRVGTGSHRGRRIAGAVLGALALSLPLCVSAQATAAPVETGHATIQHDDSLARNLIRNGTFSSPTVPYDTPYWWASGSYVVQRANGWEPINPGGFDLLNAAFAKHPSGYQAVDLGIGYNPNGGVKQDISTYRRDHYKLTFEHSPDAWGPCIGYPTDFRVAIVDKDDDREIRSRSYKAHEADGSPHWRQETLHFTATGYNTTIAFHGNTSTSCQAAITNVRVSPDY